MRKAVFASSSNSGLASQICFRLGLWFRARRPSSVRCTGRPHPDDSRRIGWRRSPTAWLRHQGQRSLGSAMAGKKPVLVNPDVRVPRRPRTRLITNSGAPPISGIGAPSTPGALMTWQSAGLDRVRSDGVRTPSLRASGRIAFVCAVGQERITPAPRPSRRSA